MQAPRKSVAVLDANAFISMGSVANLATTTRLVTSQDVLDELRDKKTREFVESLPFEIEVMDPDDKILQLVKEFSKKTGDIASLSAVDMELMAIAYAVCLKEGLGDKLRKEPPPIQEKEDLFDIAKDEISESEGEDDEDDDLEKTEVEDNTPEQENKPVRETVEDKPERKESEEDDGWVSVPVKPKRKASESSSQSSDEQAWITPQNYEKKMAEMNSSLGEETKQDAFGVWLVTADFAMQNVALQMGVALLSLDGRQVSTVRRFIYECYRCWAKYRITDDKVRLCKNCGYNSLSKIAYSVDQQGQLVLHRKRGWRPNAKILEAKERKYEQDQRKKKHQHARRKKKPSIFDY